MSGQPGAQPADGGPERERIAQVIATVFDTVLERTGSTVDDRFFRLGGDSLAGMRVLADLYERFGVRIPTTDLYDHSTPLALADRLISLRANPKRWRRSAAALARRRRGKPLPLALGQQGFYAIEQVTRGVGFFNTVTLLTLAGDVDAQALVAAIDDVVRRQTALRVVFCEAQDGSPGQRVVDRPPQITRLDLRGRGESALHRLTRMEYLRGFDLHADPPVRFTIARTADDAWALVVACHHIVFDGLSQALFVDELAHAYRCRVGVGTPRPALRADYLDFAEWQTDTLRGDRLAEHLSGLGEILREPAPRIAPQTGSGRLMSRIDDFVIPERTARGLEEHAAARDASIFVVLLAALADFGQRRTGSKRQLVTVQTANRSWPGSEEIIGCFSNMVCVGADVDPLAPPAESVAVLQAGLAQALSHEELPLDHALSLLGDQGHDLVEAGHMPDLGFALQPLSDDRIELPGCVMTAQAVQQGRENYDPTSFPLVIELGVDQGGLSAGDGKSHRLLDMWPGDSFAVAERELLSSFDRFARLG